MADIVSTATVESLQAEVRVLMVGNRQVTASMARQLDQVALADLIPMGRVRTKDNSFIYCEVIGRHRVTGALVRAEVDGGLFGGTPQAALRARLDALPLLLLGGLR